MTSVDQYFTRTIASASALGGQDIDNHRFLNKEALLTGEVEVLSTPNGAEIARNALRLLIKMCRSVSVALPPECTALIVELKAIAFEFAVGAPPVFIDGDVPLLRFHAILSVGTKVRTDLPWTTVNSNGWLVRVSSGPDELHGQCGQTNPVGALAAAAFGACEVFKRLIVLKPQRGSVLKGTTFSLWTYEVGGEEPGPGLPSILELNALLVGCGAIGNAIGYLLSQLPTAGRVDVVDSQTYAVENWATCLLVTPRQLGRPKAEFIAEILRPKLDSHPYCEEITKIHEAFRELKRWPTVVINGLDNIEARHSTQLIWSDIVFDGALAGDGSCQVSCHPWGNDVACLMCLFQEPVERAEIVQSRLTGLPEDSFADLNATLTPEHVANAPESKRAWLKERIGQTLCSIAHDAHLLSDEPRLDGFAPSMHFVASVSGAMVVTEVTRYLMTGSPLPQPRYALNLLVGPQNGEFYPETRHSDCLCMAWKKNVEKLRKQRRTQAEKLKQPAADVVT